MHKPHGDIHEIGLQDNCEACAEHAETPWRSLDKSMLNDLIRRNYHYRYTDEIGRDVEPRSVTEAIAMKNITNVMERAGSLMSADYGGYIRSYLERKWGVYFE